MSCDLNFVLIIALGICVSAVGCDSPEQKIQRYGSLTPRNSREQIIFDYHQALQDRRLEDAYQFVRGSELFQNQSQFISSREARYQKLPTLIAIGEEIKHEGSDICRSTYEVFHVGSNRRQVGSGYVSLHAHPKILGKCKISTYKAIF